MLQLTFLKETLPPEAKELLGVFCAAGAEGYLVGGCVRDALLGKAPQDYDVCTPLSPEAVLSLFAGYRTVPTGLRHGTVTVLVQGCPFEITTFRLDGEYTDSRHPKEVSFTGRLEEDLARRDFTVNAIAWSEEKGYTDPFGGMADLQNGMLRCVGDPYKRFSEDALRILRGIRFSAQLGFPLEGATAAAAATLAPSLENISRERIFCELRKLLLGKDADRVLASAVGSTVLEACIGEITPPEPALSALPPHLPLRFALLFGEHSEALLRGLKADNRLIADTSFLAAQLPLPLPDGATLHRRMATFGRGHLELFWDLLDYHRAIGAPGVDALQERAEALAEVAPLSLRELPVRGEDLLPLCVGEGRKVGWLLQQLWEKILSGQLPCDRQTLLAEARRISTED